jgi:hypothetical protein
MLPLDTGFKGVFLRVARTSTLLKDIADCTIGAWWKVQIWLHRAARLAFLKGAPLRNAREVITVKDFAEHIG